MQLKMKVRIKMYTITELRDYSEIKNMKQLESKSKKDKKLLSIYKNLLSKIKERAKLSFVNQKVQTSVTDNKTFLIKSEKYTSSKVITDTFELSAIEVKKLQQHKMSYDNFKSMFAFVSKFVLCNYSTKQNLCKHERFYSQCLAQINLVLNRYTKDVMLSRSSNIKIKQVTLDNVTSKYNEFMKLLFDTKIKTSKLVKAKSKKQVTKVNKLVTNAVKKVTA